MPFALPMRTVRTPLYIRGRAAREITDALEDTGVSVVPYRERQQVIEFARA
jgi:hypothetical protein